MEKKQHWDLFLVVLNFSILFNGFIVMLEGYLMEDRLPLTYFFVVGLISTIIGGVLTVATKKKPMKIKIVTTVLLLLIVVISNFLIN